MTIRVTDPVDLVKVLPYQLGYHPSDSLALLGLRGRHLGLVQRADLPTRHDHQAELVDLMVANLLGDGCSAAVVIVYENEPGSGARAGALLADRLRASGVPVTEHMSVRDGQVFFPESPSAEAAAGIALPADRDVPAVAQFVALGSNPSPSRAALAVRVGPGDGPAAARVKAAADRLDRLRPRELRPRAMADWGRLLDATNPAFGGAPTSAAAAARMAVSLIDVHLRDLLIAWLCPGTLEKSAFQPQLIALARARLPKSHEFGESAVEAAAAVLDRLCWLARHTPDDLAPGVLTVLASYAWWRGDGALASVALDRALGIDPAYRLAQLVERMVTMAIRPGRSA